MKREHLVPLAPQVVALLRELRGLPGSDVKSVLISFALARRVHELQHYALWPIPDGLS
jgi:hypothetical protein